MLRTATAHAPGLSQLFSLPPTHDAPPLTYTGIVEETKEGQQFTSPVEDVQPSTQQPTRPLLNNTGEIEALEEKKESLSGAVEEIDTIRAGECRGLLHLTFVTHWSRTLARCC